MAWSAITWSWDSQIMTGAPIELLLMCGAESYLVFSYDYITIQDSGAAMADAIVETRDFIWPGGKLRTDRIDMELQGDDVYVKYSIDQGNNWYDWDFVGTSVMRRYTMFRQIVGDTIRFKFTSASADFKLRWMNLIWRPESVR